jgi:L-iditol 2-dehydrogenase
MKALVKTASGKGNVSVRDVDRPVPQPDEILIQVKYCGICGTDLHIYADEFPNDPPVIMGHEYCGTVVQVGESVPDQWSVGDRVVGELHTGACGVCDLCLAGKPHICDGKLALGSRHDGAFAEYLALPAWLAHPVPDGIPWEIAGVTEPFAISTHCMIERGQLNGEGGILITGSATMGLMATIWASRLGFDPIIVAGTSMDEPVRFPLARAMGATHVVNVQKESLAAVIGVLCDGRGVNVAVECSGSPAAIHSLPGLVKKTGKIVLIGLVGPPEISVPWNDFLYKELDFVGCFSSPPSSWQKALAVESDEAHKLRQLVTHILPLEAWEQGFTMMQTGEAVKILVDMCEGIV